MADEFERIARHERQRRSSGRVEHVHVFGLHDQRLRDAILINAIRRGEADRVAGLCASQRAEHGVAVTGDADVAALTGERRVFDVARAAAKRPVVAPFEHDGG
jgi:hypothetical protein